MPKVTGPKSITAVGPSHSKLTPYKSLEDNSENPHTNCPGCKSHLTPPEGHMEKSRGCYFL